VLEIILQTHNLSKSFGALQACDEVAIDLRANEIHAVIGPNGAGKSTLIGLICGTLKPDTGTVELLGQNVSALPARKRSLSGLARTFQVSALAMEDTVLQNVLLGALGATGNPYHFLRSALNTPSLTDTAEKALQRVGLMDFAGSRTSELSHGQRRQLEVAVALTLNPKVFIMDEPMAGLGFEGSKQLTGFLDELRSEAPILLVEHDMDAVFSLADRISVLVYGKIILTGTVEEVKQNDIVREAYLGSDA